MYILLNAERICATPSDAQKLTSLNVLPLLHTSTAFLVICNMHTTDVHTSSNNFTLRQSEYVA